MDNNNSYGKSLNKSNSIQQVSIGRLFLTLLSMIALYAPVSALALGVLEPQLKSYINERLEVEIPLILSEKEKDDDILVKQVPSKDRNISDWVPELSFRLVTDANNDFTIIAKSRDVVNEPIVHFTVSIKTRYNWVYREMSFLLDPRPMKALMTPRAAKAEKEVVLKPSEAQPRKQPAPVYRQPEVPSIAPAEPVTASTGSYMVKSGDSVSLIERKFRNVRNATAQQAMVSIFNANPHAFINNDINKIKSHVEIVIPDDSEMQKLSAKEARQIFSMLLAGDQPSTEPAPPMPVPVVEPEQPEARVAAAPVIEEPPAKTEPEAPAVEEPIKEPQDYELTLTPEDADVTETTITQNEGTIVYETRESMAEKAGIPSEDMRQNIQSAVTDMEEQLTTLREEIKRLQKTLAEKEKQQAATEDSISTTQAEIGQQTVAGAADSSPEDSPGPVEMETPSSSQDSGGSFDFLRLLIEILTLGAAGGFIGYFIALRRKRASEVVDESRTGDNSYIRPVFSSGKEQGPPGEKASTYAPTPPEHTVVGKEGIEVSDANPDEYDESVQHRGSDDQEQAEEPATEEEVNPEYILQEANLSIAFSDLDNAYHLLMKLINHDPKNPEYRVLILGVLKDLLKEGEFIFHANHLAEITNRSPENDHWQKAVELGHEFLPEHELFLSVEDEITDVNPALQESETIATEDDAAEEQDEMYTTGTIVMKSEDALAEHERQMQLKEQAQEPEDTEASPAEDNKPAPLSFDELMDNDEDTAAQAMQEEQTQLSAFRQDEGIVELDTDEGAKASEQEDDSKPEPLSFDELLDADADETPASKDESHVLEYDGDPFATQSGPDSSDSEASSDTGDSGEDPYKQLQDEIKSESLVGDKKSQDRGTDDDDEDVTIVPNPKRD